MLELLKSEFLDKLVQGSSLSGRNKSIPIMNNVKMEVSSGVLSFTSTDGDNTIKTTTSMFTCDDDVSVCFDARSVIAYVRMIKDESVRLLFDSSGKIRIKHTGGVANFPVISVDEFPLVSVETDMSHHVMSAATLKEWVSIARRFASANVLRPQMCGMHLYKDGHEIGCCAMDGCSLFTDKVMSDDDGSFAVTIDSKMFVPMLSLLSTCDDVRISIGKDNVLLDSGSSNLMIRLHEGKYPNFKSVIPSEHKVEVSVDRESLLDALRRADILGNKASHLIRLEVDGLNMNVAASDVDFSTSAAEDIACDSNGNIVIGLNASRLADCLASVTSQKVRMLMSESNRPVIVKDEDKQDMALLLLMPIMLN